MIWDDVLAVAPELSVTAAATQTVVLAQVEIEIDAEVWGDYADMGRRLLAAHYGTIFTPGLSGGGATAGPVTSETLGPMSRSYATATSSNVPAELGRTKYGIEYYRLMRKAVAVPALSV